MHAEGDAQGFAVDFRMAGKYLLVDTDGQGQGVTENRESLLKLLEQSVRIFKRSRIDDGSSHGN